MAVGYLAYKDVSGGGTSTVTIPTYDPSGSDLIASVYYAGLGTQSLNDVTRNALGWDGLDNVHTVHGSTYYSGGYWFRDAKASGDYTIVINFNGVCTNHTAGVHYMSGVDQVTSSSWGFRQVNTLSGNEITLTTFTADGGLLTGAVFFQDTDADWGVTTGIERWMHNGYSSTWDQGAGGTRIGDGTSQSIVFGNIVSTSFDMSQVTSWNPAIIVEQEGFRFFKDDGSESASTGEADQDTNVTIPKGVRKRLRINRNYSGDPATEQVGLQYKDARDPDDEFRMLPLT